MDLAYDLSFNLYAYKLLHLGSKLVFGSLNEYCVVGCDNVCHFIILLCHKSILVCGSDILGTMIELRILFSSFDLACVVVCSC